MGTAVDFQCWCPLQPYCMQPIQSHFPPGPGDPSPRVLPSACDAEGAVARGSIGGGLPELLGAWAGSEETLSGLVGRVFLPDPGAADRA